MSYVVARREASRQVDQLNSDAQFYRQRILIKYVSRHNGWSGPAWEVRYQEDVLSGFTRDVRVSLFGRIIDCNFSEQLPRKGADL